MTDRILTLTQILAWLIVGFYFGMLSYERLDSRSEKTNIVAQLERQVNFEIGE